MRSPWCPSAIANRLGIGRASVYDVLGANPSRIPFPLPAELAGVEQACPVRTRRRSVPGMRPPAYDRGPVSAGWAVV